MSDVWIIILFYFILKFLLGFKIFKLLPVWSVVLCDWGIANCCVCCCRLHLLYRQQHCWLTYLSSCGGLQELLFLFLSAVARNSKSNGQSEPRHHRTRGKKRGNTLWIQWSIGTQMAPYKRQKESDRVSTFCLQSPQSTHTNWNNFYLWNWICAIYWGLGVGGEPKEDMP